jgi:phosphopantothenoylcysteine decarboxylase
MGKKILLGVTGSVAAVLTGKIFAALCEVGEVRLVFTEKGRWFVDHNAKAKQDFDEQFPLEGFGERHSSKGDIFFEEDNEWPNAYEKDDPILHIELRKWADILVIAPLSANTLAKVTHGICDNLLTSVVRAWDSQKPVVIAPAMNTCMWTNPLTQKQLVELMMRQWSVVQPVEKELACGDTGIGAMARIEDIVATTSICSDAV